MIEPDKASSESSGRGAPPADFNFDAPNDRWMEEVRQAEAPLPFGFIGPYELEKEISRGGQGIVFRARQPGTHRQVAVKRLLGGAFATPGMRRRFEREVEALTALNHPHIVTIFAMDVVDGVPVLAMEWIDGAPITRWAVDAPGGRRSSPEIARMVLTVCEAVHHAHQRGVIHRDLKPSNILIDASQTPHVVDFGLAKFSRPTDPPAGANGRFVGTLAYASPEQLRGKDEEVDVRSDVYSLGVILYELLTGQRPYEPGDSGIAATARTIEQTEPLRPSSIARGLDQDLEAIVLKALAKDRAVRYQSADVLAADLRSFLAGEPVSARPPGGWDPLRKTLRRHRVAVAFALTLLMLVSLFAAVTTVLAVRVARQRDLAFRAQANEAAARQQAEHESAKAQAINTFMQNMLASVDPRQTGDPQLTVREMLDHAAGRVESELGPLSGVKAEVNAVIGRTYQNLGLFDPAESHLRTALAHYRELPPEADVPRNETVLNLLTDLAMVLHSKGDHQAAGLITEEAIGLYRALLAQGRPLLDAEIDGLAGYYFVKGDHASATRLYEETLSAHRALLGNDHPAVAGDLAGLGMLLAHLGKFEEAITLVREGHAILRRMPNLETPPLAETAFDLARVLHEARAFDESRAEYEEALALQMRLYGDAHAVVAETLSHYANLLSKVGDLAAAEEAYRRSMSIQRGLYGDDHRGVAECQARLGNVLLDACRYEEAERELGAALEKLERILPDGHWDIAYRRRDLGRCLTALGRYAEAEPSLLSSHAVIAARHGENDWRAQHIRQSVVELYEAWSRPDEAAGWRIGVRPEATSQNADGK